MDDYLQKLIKENENLEEMIKGFEETVTSMRGNPSIAQRREQHRNNMNIIKLHSSTMGNPLKTAEMKNKELNRRLIELNLLIDGASNRDLDGMRHESLVDSFLKNKK